MLHPWLSPMSPWTRSWCILMLCSWTSHVASNTLLMHLDAMLLTFSSTRSCCYTLGFLQRHFEQGLDASWCSWISHVTFNTLLMHLDATLLTFSSTRSWCYTFAFLQCHFGQGLDASWCYALEFLMWPPTRSWCYALGILQCHLEQGLDASWCYALEFLMKLSKFQNTLDASWCYAPDFLINTLLMLHLCLFTMSLWTRSWRILMLCSWVSHVTPNTLLMHLDATLLTFPSTRSWCYALGILQCHFEQGLDACSRISHVASNTLLMYLDATLLAFSQHALDATPWAFYNVTSNMVLMHLDAMLLNFSCGFQHALDASWCYAPHFLINTLLMLHPWLSPMSPWTRSWCILMLCSWTSHVASNTLLMHLDAMLLTFSTTRSCCYTLGFLQRHFEQGLDASWCSWTSHVASNTHLGATLLTFSSTRSWCYALGFLQCHFEQGLNASWCYALEFLMKLPKFQNTLDASWCYAPDFLINTLLMLHLCLFTMSLWTRSWRILMLCSWVSHVTPNTLLMHLDATLLTFPSTRSWCYALGILQCHLEQGLDACSRISHGASNTLLMHLDATLLAFSQHALDATPWAFYNVTSNMVLMHLDAMLLNFSCSFQHALDASWCYAPHFLINTLLMLHPWLSPMSPWTRSWCILMLCSWISHVASHTLLMLCSWLSRVTSNTLLIYLDAMLSAFSCSFQHPLDATLLAFSCSFQPTRSWCILVLRSWLFHATSDTLLMLHF